MLVGFFQYDVARDREANLHKIASKDFTNEHQKYSIKLCQ